MPALFGGQSSQTQPVGPGSVPAAQTSHRPSASFQISVAESQRISCPPTTTQRRPFSPEVYSRLCTCQPSNALPCLTVVPSAHAARLDHSYGGASRTAALAAMEGWIDALADTLSGAF